MPCFIGYTKGLVYISAWASALLVLLNWAMRRPLSVGRVTVWTPTLFSYTRRNNLLTAIFGRLRRKCCCMRHFCLFSFLWVFALLACTSSSASYTEETIREIASSDDYDAMIDALYACVDECGAVKEEYLDGHMTDKDAKNKIAEITNRYAPVLKSLENADSRGDLNYDQHKALMDITKKALNHVLDGVNRVMNDIGIFGDDVEEDSSDF